MRIAEARVSGFATGLPSTSGAAPAACQPRITGLRLAVPASAASR